MSHAKNKVEWCLRKAEKEVKESGNHRGLVKSKPDLKQARGCIEKAQHYIKATEYLKKGDYSDVSATTIFFSLYHSLLAIAAKFGYESRNQECTFALIHYLIEEGKIEFDNDLLNKIASLEPKSSEETTVDIRERYQYGTEFKMDEELYNNMVKLAKEIIVIAREIIEK
ncbi:hypothetical protein HYY71_07450 [Candidatus Woesearchaeota archaeon]|nr:hypothetical protein [Candidatus Woesearchaeota archaeon]